jgi:TRAP-type C4-dicarboxylate transport system permease small subunit
MDRLRDLTHRIVVVADYVIGALLAVLVVINGAAVFQRYVMFDSISWSEEAIRYFAVWMTFLGGATASWYLEHMDMDAIGEFLGSGGRRIQKLVIEACVLGFALIVSWQSIRYCWLNGSQTAPTSGMPMVWVYGAMVVGGLLLVLVTLVRIADLLSGRDTGAERMPPA